MGYTHGKQWTEDKIKKAVFEVVDKLGLDRMPSVSEIDIHYGNTSLSNKLSKGGGIYHYANIYGLEIKNSDTAFGIKYEKYVRDILIKKGHDAELTSPRFPYDVLVNKRVKVDVKAGRIVKTGNVDYYTFNLEKQKQTCDLYIVVTLSKNDSINKIYVMPASIMSGKTQLSMGVKSSRYDKYIDRWDLIETIDNAFESIEVS
jgi:hypothetical protein